MSCQPLRFRILLSWKLFLWEETQREPGVSHTNILFFRIPVNRCIQKPNHPTGHPPVHPTPHTRAVKWNQGNSAERPESCRAPGSKGKRDKFVPHRTT